VQALKVIAA